MSVTPPLICRFCNNYYFATAFIAHFLSNPKNKSLYQFVAGSGCPLLAGIYLECLLLCSRNQCYITKFIFITEF